MTKSCLQDSCATSLYAFQQYRKVKKLFCICTMNEQVNWQLPIFWLEDTTMRFICKGRAPQVMCRFSALQGDWKVAVLPLLCKGAWSNRAVTCTVSMQNEGRKWRGKSNKYCTKVELLWLFQRPGCSWRNWGWLFLLAGSSVLNLSSSQQEPGALVCLIDSWSTGICCFFNEMENMWISLIWLVVVTPLLRLAPALQYFKLFCKQQKMQPQLFILFSWSRKNSKNYMKEKMMRKKIKKKKHPPQ